MSVINTNITSMIGQQNLNASKSALTTSMERLSSGLRINSAKDDAAGQAIANRMSAQITGLSQAQRNANDGISVAQTAEGALNQVNDNLQRVRELTVQAQNGTNSQDDLQSIQDEIGQRLNEINRISEQTDFNGVKVLSDDIAPISVQVGANDSETISVNLRGVNQEKLSLSDFDITNTLSQVSASDDDFMTGNVNFDQNIGESVTAVSIDAGATAGLGKATLNSADVITNANLEIREFDGENYAIDTSSNKVFTIESTNVNASDELDVVLGEDVTGDLAQTGGERGSSFDFTSVSGYDSEKAYSVVEDDGSNYVREEAKDGTVKYYDIDSTNTTAEGVVEVTATTENTALATSVTLDPMKKIDDALSEVDSLRSELGAVQNRFESAITNLSTNETNLSAARSRIEDADYAVEVANMTRAQILQQAGTSVLAQANQVPQSVLSLLG
ncbi:FliC/FljB family flagellin [Halomonas litopenaei]|nr:FliC/FljB family flagellin [Halomonas litopenaei]